jgi:Lysozyme like domain
VANLNGAQLETLWVKSGGDAKLAPVMAAIALAESNGNPAALNNNPKSGDFSVGLWQINYFGNLSGPRTARYGDWQKQLDPYSNTRAAVDLAQGGKGLGNWSTYTSGAYAKYLSQVPNGKSVNPAIPVRGYQGKYLFGIAVGDPVLSYPGVLAAATGGGAAAGEGAGVAAGAAGTVATVAAATGAAGIVAALMNGALWLQIVQVIGGAILLGMGLFLLMRQIGLAVPTTPLAALAAAA